MVRAENVADFLLSLCQPEIGDTMTNLKMQKLLYYAQGFHLALYDTPLFSEKIKAWQYGPVVEEIYEEYDEYGQNPIPQPKRVNTSMFNPDQINFLKEIYEVYGQFSALRLMQMAHQEPPWTTTVKGGIISHEKMKRYFKTLIKQ
jgi:uncharacterized phage-associated protein